MPPRLVITATSNRANPASHQPHDAPEPAHHRVESTVAWDRPGHVHRVLRSLPESDDAVERGQRPEHDRRRTPLDPLGPAELVADDRELGQRGGQDLLLEVGMPLEHEPEHGGSDQQDREDGDEGVVAHHRREVAALVVEELVDDPEGIPDDPMPTLEGIDAINSPGHRATLRARLSFRMGRCTQDGVDDEH